MPAPDTAPQDPPSGAAAGAAPEDPPPAPPVPPPLTSVPPPLPPRAVSPLSEPGPRYVAERLLTTLREEIARADTKAAVLLSSGVALPALALPAVRAGVGSGPVGVAGVVLWLAGIAMLAIVTLPRTRPGRPRAGPSRAGPSPTALHRGPGRGDATAAVLAAGRDPGRWLLEQSYDLGVILAAKYRWMRWAVGCLAAGGAVLATAALL
ncbi:Pycsar system effector family protein [Streptomyces sp. NPDC004134]|uniref:Pycsar system effector family protein n=1 Tax=Streptomyces sp. NPDC004134 TaxID=3364691 RepID=UPI0036BB5D08